MIDVHTHVVPPGVPFGASTPGPWPRLEVQGETGEIFTGEHRFRTLRSTSWDIDRRREAMAQTGVERQVLSPLPELLAYWADTRDARTYCDGVNEWIAEQVRRAPDAFSGLGIVPLQDPDAATDALSSIEAAGLSGVEIGSNVNGVRLHDDRFADFFAAAEHLGLVVFVHGHQPPGSETFSGATAASGVTTPNEIGLAAGGLIAEGVLHRFPALKICASHGGGSLATMLSRLEFIWDADPRFRDRLPERPSACARRIHVDSAVFDARTLRYVADVLGVDRVVTGSDFPGLPGPQTDLLVDFSPHERAQVERTNAAALFGLMAASGADAAVGPAAR